MRNNKLKFWLTSFFLILLISANFAQQKNLYSEKIKTFEKFVEQQMEIDKIPGLSIGFYKDDFFWAKGFGYADLENKTPVKENSAYRLASNTKSMVAVAILQLMEKGKVDLDAEVQRYVPYFPRKKWPVTVRPLLGHLGGISHYKNYDVEGKIREYKDTRESLEIFADWELIAEPWTKYQYSSYAYNLLGAVVEGAAKQPFGDYLKENLWDPLEMKNTYMDDPHKLLPNRVRGYRLIDGEIKNSEYIDISSRFAAGGTRSTIVDLLKYAKGLSTEKVLSKESIDLMYRSMVLKDGYFTDYGMGWVVPPVNGRFHVYHTGGQPETRTLLVRFPNENFALALAYNLEGANLHVYSHRLLQLIFDEPWNMNVYTGNKIDDALIYGMWSVFNYGLGYFDRYEQALTVDEKELAGAIDYFNLCMNRDSLKSDHNKFVKKIKSGRHPAANQAFVKIGSYMAKQLQENNGANSLKKYTKVGAIGFFDDYLKMYKKAPGHSVKFQFSESFEKIVKKWNQDWTLVFNDYTRELALTPFSNVTTIAKKLKKLFAGADVYPNFAEDFSRITRNFYLQGDKKKTFETAKLTLKLYPNSTLANVMLANSYIRFGEKDKALQFYKKAIRINPDDRYVSVSNLNYYALNMKRAGLLDEALEMLKIIVELYPDEALPYNSIAEIYLQRGKTYFKKALKVDPTFEAARKRLKKIRE